MEMKGVTEDTPLIRHEECTQRTHYFAFWRPTSATHRFFLLLLFSLIPFGGHFVKNGMSSLEPLIIHDPSFPFTNTMYGALISAVSVPNMFIPLMGGRLLDRSGHRSIRFFLVWICIGQIIFAIGMACHWFWLALFGRVFFGVGEGSVVVGARVFVAYWYCSKELTFAMGMMVAITNISKMIAKATVAPIALYFGGYIHALWYGVVICLFSVGIGIITCTFTTKLKQMVKQRVQQNQPLQAELEWLEDYANTKRKEYQQHVLLSSHSQPMHCKSVCHFTPLFWTIALLHVVFVTVFHLFQNVSSSFLYERYGYSVVKSGLVSAVSHSFVVFAPFIGLIIDHFGGRMYWIVGSAILSIVAYGLMIFTETNPLVSMMMISICLSFTPTILMAVIPNSVNRRSFGAAFGIVEITDAVGATLGNLMIGYLRDATGSYDVDMYVLLGMSILTFVGSIVLVVQDKQKGGVLSAHNSRTRSLSLGDDANIIGLAHFTEDEDSGSGTMSPKSKASTPNQTTRKAMYNSSDSSDTKDSSLLV